MSFAAAYQRQVERSMFGRQAFTAPPATIYAAAFVGSTEQTSNGWARVAVANDTTTFPSATPLVNAVAINFPALSVSSNNVDVIRFYDAASGGNEIGRSEAFTPVTVAAGAHLGIPVGGLTIAVA